MIETDGSKGSDRNLNHLRDEHPVTRQRAQRGHEERIERFEPGRRRAVEAERAVAQHAGRHIPVFVLENPRGDQ